MIPYALAIFAGAFLLFQVQPLIGKFILPWFGGGPGVWTTCLLFFQVVLLGGYAYAHALSRGFRLRTQAIIHGALLLAAAATLPIAPGEFWKQHLAGNPTWEILMLLSATIGLPYFVLSSTGPLMQQWFSWAKPGVSPYRLYALSNAASLLALLSYPTYFEVKFSRYSQSTLWSAGFVLFAIVCGFSAWRTTRSAEAPQAPASSATPANTLDPVDEQLARPSVADRLLWIALPAIASILLLAATNKLCQEIAVIPFLWVLPLSLYLLTFVICFDHARWYHRGIVVTLLTIGIACVFQIMPAGNTVPMALQIACYTATLFLACMFCHGELYQLKPAPRYLTSFYLAISAGGALGGFLVAVVAPAVFSEYRELPIGLWALTYVAGVVCIRQRSVSIAMGSGIGLMLATFVLPLLRARFTDGIGIKNEWLFLYSYHGWFIFGGLAVFLGCMFDTRTRHLSRVWQPRMGGFVMALSVVLAVFVIFNWRSTFGDGVVDASRNFYGTLKVYQYDANDPENRSYVLVHGATTHGLQYTADDKAMRPTTYYGETSGVGLALAHLPRPAGERRLGLVGLGTGTIAAYGKAGDYMRIYEINPAVEDLARSRFTYLKRTPANVDVILGDARLSMESELAADTPQKFDLLALDAFSSDAIPVHLLTKEAFGVYLRHMKPDGVIAVHISNRYLDLQPVVERLAAEHGMVVVTISDDEKRVDWVYRTTWMLVTRNEALLAQEEIVTVSEPAGPGAKTGPLWTDDHASVFQVVR